MAELLDIKELEAFSKRALLYIQKNYPKQSKTVMRKVGQRAVKLTKAELKAKGIKTKSPLYRAIKKTGVWKSGKDYAIRTYVSSHARDENGNNARVYAWLAEHGHKMVNTRTGEDTGKKSTPVRYESGAISKTEKEYADVLEDYINELLDKGMSLGT